MKRITRTLIFIARRLCTLAVSVTAHVADSLDFLSELLSEEAANSPPDSKNEVEYDPPRQLDDGHYEYTITKDTAYIGYYPNGSSWAIEKVEAGHTWREGATQEVFHIGASEEEAIAYYHMLHE